MFNKTNGSGTGNAILRKLIQYAKNLLSSEVQGY